MNSVDEIVREANIACGEAPQSPSPLPINRLSITRNEEKIKEQHDIELRYKTFYSESARPVSVERCTTEWAYALLYDFYNSDMQRDLIVLLKTVASFFLDMPYSDRVKRASEEYIGGGDGGSGEFVLRMPPPMRRPTAKKKITENEYIQEYISFVFSLLVLNNSFTRDKEGEFSVYHKFICLVIIGVEPHVRDQIIKLQKEILISKRVQEKEAKDVMERLQRLLNYCENQAPEIVKTPFNCHNSPNLVRNFILMACMAYQGCMVHVG